MTTLPPDTAATGDVAGDVPGDKRPIPKHPERHSSVRGAIEWVVVIVGAVAIALIVKAFVAQAFWIPSGSMLPTLEINDRVLVDKVGYHFHGPNRGDIVVFEHADSQLAESKDLIKRVIGIPGDSLYIDDAASKVVVNGQALVEPYVKTGSVTINNGSALRCTQAKPCVVPANSYFVMGDNRDNSRDSRFIGYITGDEIVGRAFVRVWPFGRFGGI